MDALIGAFLLVGGYQDYKRRMVENWVPCGMFVIAVFFHIRDGTQTEMLLGISVMGLLSLSYYKWGKIGGGDVKIIISIGAYCGVFQSWLILLLAFVWSYFEARINGGKSEHDGESWRGSPLVAMMAIIYGVMLGLSKLAA